MELTTLYEKLLKKFGRQEWWPARRDFSPKEWEICVGAILTQNTNWNNVERALDNLRRKGITSPRGTLKIRTEELERVIRPSGFYRQKAERLKTLARFILDFGSFSEFRKNVKRNELLGMKGIGPETCDSILLYACGRPCFVIDSYTRRFVRAFGLDVAEDYESLREFFESSVRKDVELYKEFHALIVEWGKRE